jgi:G3E family GTPase
VLVAGFLGAGKTTVVNHLLAHAEGKRIAAVVNDFGAINIDAELITGAADGVVSLSNGCICCSLEGDLLRTLAGLLRRDPRPEVIVIETSGVADPLDIVRNLMDPVIWREAPLETVLCVVDATAAPAMFDDALLRSQIRAADIVALTKVDLADAVNHAQVRDAVRAIRPAAVLVDAPHGEVPAAGAARAGTAASCGGSLRSAELDIGTAGVVAAVAGRDQPARAEAGAGEGAV